MLGQRHDLDCAVARLDNPRQDVAPKLVVGPHLGFVLRHADVRLVEE